ncbi:MAG: ribonuclease Z [DPANN group archaeon]|nr:ribonuclease Z [DPANN group archaeon]
MRVTFLGTSSAVPTRDRSLSAVHFKYRGTDFLFDCGEGTQRQFTHAGISPHKLDAVFISHEHADHMLGLAGLIQTLNMQNRQQELKVYGPIGIKRYVDFFKTLGGLKLVYPVTAIEINGPGKVFENLDVEVHAFPVNHVTECYAFKVVEKVEANLDKAKLKKLGLLDSPANRQLKEKGEIEWQGKMIKLEDISKPLKKPLQVAYVIDSRFDESIIRNVEGVDLLVIEATFAEKERESAKLGGHMTAREAATIAKRAKAKRLALTHFSSRYSDDMSILKREAGEVFKKPVFAEDFMTIEV